MSEVKIERVELEKVWRLMIDGMFRIIYSEQPAFSTDYSMTIIIVYVSFWIYVQFVFGTKTKPTCVIYDFNRVYLTVITRCTHL